MGHTVNKLRPAFDLSLSGTKADVSELIFFYFYHGVSDCSLSLSSRQKVLADEPFKYSLISMSLHPVHGSCWPLALCLKFSTPY